MTEVKSLSESDPKQFHSFIRVMKWFRVSESKQNNCDRLSDSHDLVFYYPQQEPKFNTSCATAESVPAEACKQRPARAKTKGKTKLVEVKQSEEQKPKLVEKSGVQRKEDKVEPNKQVDSLII